MKLTKEHYILIALTTLGAIFRLYNLGRESLWLDEAATLMFVESGFFGMWEHFTTWEPNPPLFIWLTIPIVSIVKSEFTLRLIPAIAGIATVPAIYYLGKVWRNSTTGLVAASLLALSPLHIYYSQEARAYSLVTLFAVLMLYCFLKAMETKEYNWWAFTSVCAGLALWTHLYAGILIAAIYMYAFFDAWTNKDKLKRVLVSSVIFTWVVLPIILVGYHLAKIRIGGGAVFGIKGIYVITDLLWNFGNYTNWIAVIFVALACIGIYLIHRDDKKKSFFVIFVLAVVFGASVILSYSMPMVARYLLFLLPLFLLLVAESLNLVRDRRFQVVAVCSLLALSVPTFTIYYSGAYIKDDWRGFGSYLQHTTKDGDTVILIPGYLNLPLANYYNSSDDHTTMVLVSNMSDLTTGIVPGSTWVVVTPDVNAVPELRSVPTLLNEHGKPISRWVYSIDLYRF